MTSGILCLHGFSGGPFELAPLAAALASQGLTIDAPTLAGHGGTLDALAASTWPDWYESAERSLKSLTLRSGPCVIVGGSMGGLLAIRLARLHAGDVAGLVLLAPPMRLRPIEQSGIGALTSLAAALGLGRGASVPRTGRPDITNAAEVTDLPYGDSYPLSALRSLIELQSVAHDDLEHVTAPVLIVQGRRDRTVPLDVSSEIAARIGSRRTEQLWLEESGHLVALDVERAQLIQAVTAFVSSAEVHQR
jgi:carboxylesterase